MNVNVVGASQVVRVDIRPSADLYAIGDTVGQAGGEGNDGGKIPIAGAFRGVRGSGVLQSLVLFDEHGNKPALNIYFYDAKPSGDYPDNAAWPDLIDGNDGAQKLVGVVQVAAADWVQENGAGSAVVAKTGLGIVVRGSGITTLYAAICLNGAAQWTGYPAASGELVMMVGVLQD